MFLKRILFPLFVFSLFCRNEFADDDFFVSIKKKESHFYILHGFLNYKPLDLLIHLKDKSTEPNVRDVGKECSDRTFSIFHILWQLMKFSFFYKEMIDKNKFWFINFKIFGFEYGPKYKFIGCTVKNLLKDHYCIFEDQDKNGHKCILSRVGVFSVDGGVEFSYKKNKQKFIRHYFACSIAGSITFTCGLPDFIIRYCPFIYSYKNNFYLRFELVQLSIGNIASSIWSYKDENTPAGKTIKDENTPAGKTIWENIFVKGIFRSILYNIKIEIGKSFDIE